MKHVTNQELRQWESQNRDYTLINVLDPEEFQRKRIAGSINVPLEHEGFEKEVQQAVGSKDQDVVVYCSGPECDASSRAAERLEKVGFKNVYEFDGGLQEWEDSGLPLEFPPKH